MIVTLEFNLPEEEVSLRNALDSPMILSELAQFRETLRTYSKHGWPHPSDSVQDVMDRVYSDFLDQFDYFFGR
jgi:hypothetical protein